MTVKSKNEFLEMVQKILDSWSGDTVDVQLTKYHSWASIHLEEVKKKMKHHRNTGKAYMVIPRNYNKNRRTKRCIMGNKLMKPCHGKYKLQNEVNMSFKARYSMMC